MKAGAWWAAAGAALVCWTAAEGATMAHAGPRDSLLTEGPLGRLSLGADYERAARDVDFDEGPGDTLTTRHYAAYLGFDVMPWLTVYGTIGELEGRLRGSAYEGGDVRWSAGGRLNLWHTDLEDPEFLAGRYGLQAAVEYAESSFDEAELETEWRELQAALTLNVELFVEHVEALERVPYSLVLYVGPTFATVDGDQALAGGGEAEFEESEVFGVLFGTDLFLSHNFSVGVHLQQIGRTSVRTGLRYHF
jgi:hypothetical protein